MAEKLNWSKTFERCVREIKDICGGRGRGDRSEESKEQGVMFNELSEAARWRYLVRYVPLPGRKKKVSLCSTVSVVHSYLDEKKGKQPARVIDTIQRKKMNLFADIIFVNACSKKPFKYSFNIQAFPGDGNDSDAGKIFAP